MLLLIFITLKKDQFFSRDLFLFFTVLFFFTKEDEDTVIKSKRESKSSLTATDHGPFSTVSISWIYGQYTNPPGIAKESIPKDPPPVRVEVIRGASTIKGSPPLPPIAEN